MRRFQTLQRLSTVARAAQAPYVRRHLSTAKAAATRPDWGFAGVLAASAAAAGLYGLGVVQAKSPEEEHYKYVIIGAGVAARACLNTLNNIDAEGKVLMIGNNPRMNSLGYTDKDLAELEAPTNHPSNNLLLGHEAHHLDVQKKEVKLHDGTVVKFDKCFIATGGHYPNFKNVKPAAADRVTTFRRKQDLQRLIEAANAGKIEHVTVVGGGSLGTEIALAIRAKAPKVKVTQLYAEPGVMHRSLPEYFRAYCTALLRGQGVDQRNFSLVSDVDVDKTSGRLTLTVDSWEQYYLTSDHVVFAPTHIDANTDLAEEAGLEIDPVNSGVVVNAELQAFSDIYVGGDAASYPSKYLGRRRDQNYDHAVKTGVVAAKNMAGGREVYDNIPVATVSLPSIGLNNIMIGNTDARLETLGFWEMAKPKRKSGKTEEQLFFTSKFNKGVTYFLDNGYVVGVMLTNIEDKEDMSRARQVIRDQVDYTDLKRQDMEQELREQLGFELQLPMTRATMAKGSGDERKQEKNIYKAKRHVTEGLQSHKTDVLKDANTNLYWGKV